MLIVGGNLRQTLVFLLVVGQDSLGVAGENEDGSSKELVLSSGSDLLFGCKKLMSIMRVGWCCNRKKLYQ